MKKKLFALSMATLMVLLSAACGSDSSKKEIPDLSGVWKSKDNDGSYQEANITSDTIEINWISDGGTTKSIYPEFPGKSGSTLTGGPTATP